MSKRPKPVDREKLVEDRHLAVRAFIAGNGGQTWRIGPIRVEVHNPTSYDVVIECVGERPKPAG